MRLFQPIRKLEYEIQKLVSRQSAWNLGHNTETCIKLFSRYYIPPSDARYIDFHLSFSVTTYRATLDVTPYDRKRPIASVELGQNDVSLVKDLECLIATLSTLPLTQNDKRFKEMLKSKVSMACIIERTAYHPIKESLPLPKLINNDLS